MWTRSEIANSGEATITTEFSGIDRVNGNEAGPCQGHGVFTVTLKVDPGYCAAPSSRRDRRDAARVAQQRLARDDRHLQRPQRELVVQDGDAESGDDK